MDAPILVAIISAAASIGVAAVTFFLTKKKEREAEWRKLKLEHYRELLDALGSAVVAGSTSDEQRRWTKATNAIGLVASQRVLAALSKFHDAAIALRNSEPVTEGPEHWLRQLLLAIRDDLGVSP